MVQLHNSSSLLVTGDSLLVCNSENVMLLCAVHKTPRAHPVGASMKIMITSMCDGDTTATFCSMGQLVCMQAYPKHLKSCCLFTVVPLANRKLRSHERLVEISSITGTVLYRKHVCMNGERACQVTGTLL
jgi:hypothetical protein